MTYVEPPEGWLSFGSLIDYDGPSECSEETGEDGLPLWERPTGPPAGGHTCRPCPCGVQPPHCPHAHVAIEPRRTWVCDRCMRTVTRDQISDFADGEHVLCVLCLPRK